MRVFQTRGSWLKPGHEAEPSVFKELREGKCVAV